MLFPLPKLQFLSATLWFQVVFYGMSVFYDILVYKIATQHRLECTLFKSRYMHFEMLVLFKLSCSLTRIHKTNNFVVIASPLKYHSCNIWITFIALESF